MSILGCSVTSESIVQVTVGVLEYHHWIESTESSIATVLIEDDMLLINVWDCSDF